MGFSGVITANRRTANLSGGVRYVGIQNMEQTVVSEENGGVNVLTITLTNGEKQTFEVRNGVSKVELDATLEKEGMAADSKAVGDRLKKAEDHIADLLYKPISITAFGNSIGTVEMGNEVTAVTLTWAVNKTPETLNLYTNVGTDEGESLTPTLLTHKMEGLSITENLTWRLTATDERGASSSKTTSITFLNGAYYGAAVQPETVDSKFILSLTKTLTGTRARTITVNAGEEQYIWYAIPARLGACTFKVGGFEGGFDLVATMDFTNGYGYTEQYLVYRSAQPGLGSAKVEVS